MMPVLAILRESWLSLRSQGLFKIAMGLNVLVIAGFASIGFDATGISVFFGLGHIDNEFVTAGSPWASIVYLGIFSLFIVNVWLAWISAIIALLSTSSIVPNFVSQGAVELTVSRPVSRTTIFLTKYVGGLLFVVLQVGVFSIGAFFTAGFRIGVWDPAMFLAIPLVTLFFSYLFCVNVLIGVITRSTLTALIVTLAFWFTTFSLQSADNLAQVAQLQEESAINRLDDSISEALATGSLGDPDESVQKMQQRLEQRTESLATLKAWTGPLGIARWFLPETTNTVGLLKIALEHDASTTFEDILSGRIFQPKEKPKDDFQKAQVEQQEVIAAIPWWLTIGKSLIFEAVILTFAVWIFRRRDY
jgi:ABC-type transport system involved in multi-copper enzyme maturation permease subunit